MSWGTKSVPFHMGRFAILLIPHMLARFMATDRGFAKARRNLREQRSSTQAKPPIPDPEQSSLRN